jgi:hypothetical protein
MEESGRYGRRYMEGRYGEHYGERYGDGDSYGDEGYFARGRGRNARRDSMGRYADGWMDKLSEMEENAPDERTRREVQKFRMKLESH